MIVDTAPPTTATTSDERRRPSERRVTRMLARLAVALVMAGAALAGTTAVQESVAGPPAAEAANGGRQVLLLNTNWCNSRGGIRYMNVFTSWQTNYWSGRARPIDRNTHYVDIRGVRGNWRGPYSYNVTVQTKCWNGQWRTSYAYVPRNRQTQWSIWF